MEILGKIFGSSARIKVMRLFLLNKTKVFTNKDIENRSRVKTDTVRREVKVLEHADFIKKRPNGWIFNPLFKYVKEFEGLLVTSEILEKEAIAPYFKKVGRIKLLVVAGIFIKNKESRVDLLIVGDKLNRSKVEEAIRKIEAEIGIELVYAMFATKEFVYRLNMYDKLVRDILDFPHEVILQAKELSTQALKKP